MYSSLELSAPFSQIGTTPYAMFPTLGSGHDCLALLTRPCFSLFEIYCVILYPHVDLITVVHRHTSSHNILIMGRLTLTVAFGCLKVFSLKSSPNHGLHSYHMDVS